MYWIFVAMLFAGYLLYLTGVIDGQAADSFVFMVTPVIVVTYLVDLYRHGE